MKPLANMCWHAAIRTVLRQPRKVLGLMMLVAILPVLGADAPPRFFATTGDPGDRQPEPVVANLEALRTTRHVTRGQPDLKALTGDRVAFNLPDGRELLANRQDIGFTGAFHPTWLGTTADELGSIALVINGDRVSGTIVTESASYELFPLSNGECAIVERDPVAFPECGTGTVELAGLVPGTAAEPAPAGPEGKGDVFSDSSSGDSLGDTPSGNRVRVLVAFTSGALTGVQGLGRTMQEHIDLAVTESNQGYANSGVFMRMELACLYQTGYNETTAIETDVARFRNSGDGFADEVHTLRASYDADMCCLLTDGTDPSWCGWAYAFDYTSYANMFQATVFSCATGNYTFAHEFGHTQGCRHNNDSTLTPFPYGHGFRNGSNWRTVMALAEGTGAPRLNYWSNPDINSPVSPFTAMGTPINGGNFANDNESALDFGDATVVNHEATPGSSNTPSNDSFGNHEAADKVVTDTLTVANFDAFSGSRIQFRTGNQIVLQAGVHARPGSVLRARIASPLGDPAMGNDANPEMVQVQQTEEVAADSSEPPVRSKDGLLPGREGPDALVTAAGLENTDTAKSARTAPAQTGALSPGQERPGNAAAAAKQGQPAGPLPRVSQQPSKGLIPGQEGP